MIDCTKYSEKGFLQLLKGNREFTNAIAEGEDWKKITDILGSLGLKYTDAQLTIVRNWFESKEKV